MNATRHLAKIGKKQGIGAVLIVAVALVAFVAGSFQTRNETSRSDADGRTPASVKPTSPEKDSSPSEEDHRVDEDVDVQFAREGDAEGAKIARDTLVVHPSSADAKHEVKVDAKPESRGAFMRLVDVYADAWFSVQDKVQSLKRVEEENRRLRMENSNLRVLLETQRYERKVEAAKEKTDRVGGKLAKDSGSKASRSIASIRYRFPENLQPEQLHALGVSYFKAHDDEKAAVILHFLTDLEEDRRFRTAANHLMAGIAFYRLENYKYAAEYFDKALAADDSDETAEKARRQANYWKALVAERVKDRRTAQNLLLQSMEQDPKSQEALWVNPQAGSGRMPASQSSGKKVKTGKSAKKGSHDGQPRAD